MNWLMLLLAGLFEVVGVIGMKRIATKETWYNYGMFIGGFLISFSLLMSAMERIPLATAYATWTGIGTVGAVLVGMVFFHEARRPLKLFCIAGVVLSVIGLRLLT